MRFEWDPEKARANRAKHGVDLAEAVAVLFDDLALTKADVDEDEERFVSIGADSLNRVLVVVYTWRKNRIRVISARKATRREREQYEEGR